MPSQRLQTTRTAMYFTAVLLTSTLAPTATPIARADAASDFQGLQDTIRLSANTIGKPVNSSNQVGTGGGNIPVVQGAIGTADLVNNVTQTLLKAQYNFNVDQNGWVNGSQYLDDPYIGYVSAIPDLAASIMSLGRAWHWEMNMPVYTAVDGFQQAISSFSSSLLSAGVIHANSTIRTIRASSSLEDAQQAWSKPLNFPGSASYKSKTMLAGRRRRSLGHMRGLTWDKAEWDESNKQGQAEYAHVDTPKGSTVMDNTHESEEKRQGSYVVTINGETLTMYPGKPNAIWVPEQSIWKKDAAALRAGVHHHHHADGTPVVHRRSPKPASLPENENVARYYPVAFVA